ncbi:MAG TPA: GGDEF domain-containing protein [Actinophytocola sp.]|nr:GGDEF domain-containing protein [Actinophytocola sp.]
MGDDSAGHQRRGLTSWRRWSIWERPPRVLFYLVCVEVAAILASVYTALLFPVSTTDWIMVACLAACAITHIEATRAVERQREMAAGAGPYLDLKSVWNFAALLVLPPSLATGLVVLTYGYAWFRVWPQKRGLAAHRWVFSGATVVLATQVAVAVLAFTVPAYPGLPVGPYAVAVVAAVGAVRWLINYALVLLVLALSQPETKARELVSGFRDQSLEAGMIGLAWAAAVLLVHQPFALIGVVVALITLQQTVLLGQYRRKSEIDAKTGLLSWGYWEGQATQVLTRAHHRGTTGGLLITDVDHFKRVNDTCGHPAGDRVLVAVAEAVKGEVRDGFDLVGRYGGEEFVVLLPDTDAAGTTQAAERIRRCVERAVVDVQTPDGPREIRATISIGVARYPDNGVTLEELKDSADFALLEAKNGGRNQVRVALPNTVSGEPAGTDGEPAPADAQ